MSKLSDYSKFDHLDDSDEEDLITKPQAAALLSSPADVEHVVHTSSSAAVPSSSSSSSTDVAVAGTAAAQHQRHSVISNRFNFEYDGASIYEWEQSLTEVTLYVPAPPQPSSVRNGDANKIVCKISARHLQLGLQGAAQLFLDAPTFLPVDTDKSTWCLEDDDDNDNKKVIAIYLHKAAKGVVWEAPLTGRFSAVLDPLSSQHVQKALMLERWQEENPGMDFRDAEFNGRAPDPRTFMGGIQYD